MAKKLSGKALADFEAGRDVWREVLDGVREIKAGGRQAHEGETAISSGASAAQQWFVAGKIRSRTRSF
jgi:hypothetical protein